MEDVAGESIQLNADIRLGATLHKVIKEFITTEDEFI